jgi:hypothetical protein
LNTRTERLSVRSPDATHAMAAVTAFHRSVRQLIVP